jgi:RNase adaptor protein for sRNA GlmZ degradation
MAKVLVTGMSGTGKSAALVALGRRGHRVVDTDADYWSRWSTGGDGVPDWVWREERIAELLDGHGGRHLFVAGCRSNQGQFHARFDEVVLLSAAVDVMLARIERRTDNPFGKCAAERERILADRAAVEPLLRRAATVEIDTSVAPLEEVVRRLEQIAASDHPPAGA